MTRRPSVMAGVTPRALYALAAALGLACVALAAWGWRVGRRFEDQLARAAHAQAEVLSRDFAEDARPRSMATMERIFAPFSSGRLPWGPSAPEGVLRSIRDLHECKCIAVVAAHGGAFWWSSRRPDHLETRGVEPSRADALRRAVADAHPARAPGGPRVVLLTRDGDDRAMLAPTYHETKDGVTNVVGFVADQDEFALALLAPTAEYVNERRYGSAAERMVAWRIVRPDGDTAVGLGHFDPKAASADVAFLRQRFVNDSAAVTESFLLRDSAPSRDAADSARAVRQRQWRVIVQVHPVAFGEFLYGTGRVPTLPIVALLAVTLILTAATLYLARRFVLHVQEREAFASAVAHDLRTPLTQILLYGESLQLDRPAVRAREEAARVIVREARRLIHIVENALHFARGARARPTLRLVHLDLGEVVRETIGGLEPILQRAGVTAELQFDDDVQVRADPDAVAQVLTNLVDNAVRFGPRGQVVTLRLRVAGQQAVLEVDDEGPGIPESLRRDVFKPFVRAGRSQGTGIGLAVSMQLVELMDGTLTASSAPSGGARLVVALQVAREPALVPTSPVEREA